jgi:hypothetical protein
LGLARYMTFDDLYEYFKSGRSPVDELSVSDLKKYNLEKRSQDMLNYKEKAAAELETMEKEGFVIDTQFGKAVVDIGERVPLGFRAVKGNGYSTLLKWFPENNGFFVSTPTSMPKDMFPKGKNIRGKMWITEKDPNAKTNKATITLKQVLDKLTGTDFKGEGKLKEFLETNS